MWRAYAKVSSCCPKGNKVGPMAPLTNVFSVRTQQHSRVFFSAWYVCALLSIASFVGSSGWLVKLILFSYLLCNMCDAVGPKFNWEMWISREWKIGLSELPFWFTWKRIRNAEQINQTTTKSFKCECESVKRGDLHLSGVNWMKYYEMTSSRIMCVCARVNWAMLPVHKHCTLIDNNYNG